MKKILSLLLILISFCSYAQISLMGGVASRVTDSTAYVTNPKVIQAHSDGYSDIWYYATSQTMYQWDGSAYVEVGSSGGGGTTLYTGNGTLSSNRTVDGDGKSLTISNLSAMTLSGTGNMTVGSSAGHVNLAALNEIQLLLGEDLSVNGDGGTSGQILTSNGNGVAPTWEDAASGGGSGINTFDPNEQTGSNYTAVLADTIRVTLMNSGSAQTFTVPQDDLPVGTVLQFVKIGAGDVTITPETGSVILTNPSASLVVTEENLPVYLYQFDVNEWFVWISATSGGGGHVIEDEGTPVAQQDTLNFTGAGVSVADSGGKTVVTISSSPALQFAASDEVTILTAGTGKISFRMPYAMTLSSVRASLVSAQTGNGSGGIFTVDINESGSTILSTKLTIDNNETTSVTAATPAVISDSSLADDAIITIDIDQTGNGTAAGLKITFKP